MSFLRRRSKDPLSEDCAPIVRLWLLRLMVELGGHRDFIDENGFDNDALAESLGLADWVDLEDDAFDAKAARTALRKQHRLAQKQWHSEQAPDCLRANVAQLAALVGLSSTDSRILEFAVVMQSESALLEVANKVSIPSVNKLFHALAVVLDLPEGDVRTSLHASGMLAKSGLLSVDYANQVTLGYRLDLPTPRFAETMVNTETDPVDLLRDTVLRAARAELSLADFAHMNSELALLQPYLHHAVTNRQRGVNIFIHGKPGTGKNQMAKALAQHLDCALFEVASESDEGNPVGGEQRLRAFRAAQVLLSRRSSILLFDEVEDVFNDADTSLGKKSTAQGRKAWLNRMLEENPVPTLWLANSIRSLDPAFIRRFDMVFELPVPPKAQRERILRNTCADLMDAAQIARIAECEVLAPAVATRAARVVRSIQAHIGPQAIPGAVCQLIDQTLQAQGHKRLRQSDANRLPDLYKPAYINADADLAALACGLAKSKTGRLCLYGPPGTGKTAFGRWLAQQMAVPLVVKRASDLMSMWVGGNEQNIAAAFKQAQADEGILLIDEVDSFLQDRRGAQRGWEVSMVNEMLTQMESFPGIFIASTNLMQGLDAAALRRFDLKVKFDFMLPQQSQLLLASHCQELALQLPNDAEMAQVARLQNLTPGDFAAVARQARFRTLDSVAAMVQALADEGALKESKTTKIGFM